MQISTAPRSHTGIIEYLTFHAGSFVDTWLRCSETWFWQRGCGGKSLPSNDVHVRLRGFADVGTQDLNIPRECLNIPWAVLIRCVCCYMKLWILYLFIYFGTREMNKSKISAKEHNGGLSNILWCLVIMISRIYV